MLPSLNEEEEDDVMESDEEESHEKKNDIPVFTIKHTQLGKFKPKARKNSNPQGVVNSNYVSDDEDPEFTVRLLGKIFL